MKHGQIGSQQTITRIMMMIIRTGKNLPLLLLQVLLQWRIPIPFRPRKMMIIPIPPTMAMIPPLNLNHNHNHNLVITITITTTILKIVTTSLLEK